MFLRRCVCVCVCVCVLVCACVCVRVCVYVHNGCEPAVTIALLWNYTAALFKTSDVSLFALPTVAW
jgi:hypothetical protein